MEAQTRHSGTTVVNHLLVSGFYDTVSRLFYDSCRIKGYIANHSKENDLGRGDGS